MLNGRTKRSPLLTRNLFTLVHFCVFSRYVSHGSIFLYPPRASVYYSCSILIVDLIGDFPLSRNISFTTASFSAEFETLVLDGRQKYSFKVQFEPKRKSSKLGFAATRCCGRFSYSRSHTLCKCKWNCRICRFSPVDKFYKN